MAITIITVGLAPSWDVSYQFKDGIDWNTHPEVSVKHKTPGGKAFNVSKALGAMGVSSKASGLWGKDDLSLLKSYVKKHYPLISLHMSSTPGSTRENVTVVDQKQMREMHLRNQNDLLSKASLTNLQIKLTVHCKQNNIMVFGGAMREPRYFAAVNTMFKQCAVGNVKIALDTSGPALPYHINKGHVWLVKPNLAELSQLVGIDVPDNQGAIIAAASSILHKVPYLLVSRGAQGVILVSIDGVYKANYCGKPIKITTTVGAGDYLLAGFLGEYAQTGDLPKSIITGIRVAIMRCQGKGNHLKFGQLRKIDVKIAKV